MEMKIVTLTVPEGFVRYKEDPMKEKKREVQAPKLFYFAVIVALSCILATLLFNIFSGSDEVDPIPENTASSSYTYKTIPLTEKLLTFYEVPENEIPVEAIIEAAKNVQKEQTKNIRTETFKATSYCACEKCCGKWAKNRPVAEDGHTIVYGAAGVELISGYSVAVDPKYIPFGTKLYDENGNEYIAVDTGSAVKGYHIDIYRASHEEARKWGVQYITLSWEVS